MTRSLLRAACAALSLGVWGPTRLLADDGRDAGPAPTAATSPPTDDDALDDATWDALPESTRDALRAFEAEMGTRLVRA